MLWHLVQSRLLRTLLGTLPQHHCDEITLVIGNIRSPRAVLPRLIRGRGVASIPLSRSRQGAVTSREQRAPPPASPTAPNPPQQTQRRRLMI